MKYARYGKLATLWLLLFFVIEVPVHWLLAPVIGSLWLPIYIGVGVVVGFVSAIALAGCASEGYFLNGLAVVLGLLLAVAQGLTSWRQSGGFLALAVVGGIVFLGAAAFLAWLWGEHEPVSG